MKDCAVEKINNIKNDIPVLKQNKINYNSIDLAKFICSILVVMIHVAPLGVSQNGITTHINFVLQKGLSRIAVPLFFVFNGFFLYRKTPLDKFSVQPTKVYFIHILKLYIIWSLIYFPFSFLSIIRHPDGFLRGLVVYIRNFVLTGSCTHLWYLNALLFAILVISFLLYKNWKPKKILYLSLFFYVIGLLGNGYFGITSLLFNTPFSKKVIEWYFNVFDTTRNGLFFAFFFVSIGMVLSNSKTEYSTKKCLFLFLPSLFMMCTEAVLLERFNIARDYNIYIFTIPSCIFCFLLLKSLKLKDRKIYKTLRENSSLIYYGHMFVNTIILRCTMPFREEIKSTPFIFVTTLVLTILMALLIIKISNKKHFHWLKKIY